MNWYCILGYFLTRNHQILLQISINLACENVNQINSYIWVVTMTNWKFFTRTTWSTWISMGPSTSSWKHLRRPWQEVWPPQTFTHDIILSGIVPSKYSDFSLEYISHNQVMNNLQSCILFLEETQNLSSASGRCSLMLLIFFPTIGHLLSRLFLFCCLIPASKYTSYIMSILSALL